MGKTLTFLEKQLQSEYKQDAEDCLRIYNALKEKTGRVWESDWNPLVSTRFEGWYPNSVRLYRPTSIGYVFLKGLN